MQNSVQWQYWFVVPFVSKDVICISTLKYRHKPYVDKMYSFSSIGELHSGALLYWRLDAKRPYACIGIALYF